MPSASFKIDTSGNGSGGGKLAARLPRGGTRCQVALIGTSTDWTPDGDSGAGSPTFVLAGGAGAAIVSQAIHSPTLAVLIVNAGAVRCALTITDPQNQVSQTVTVAATFEEHMLTRIETLLEEAAGLVTFTLDGQMVTVQDLAAQRDFWLRRVNQQQGKRPRVSTINLSGWGGRG